MSTIAKTPPKHGIMAECPTTQLWLDQVKHTAHHIDRNLTSVPQPFSISNGNCRYAVSHSTQPLNDMWAYNFGTSSWKNMTSDNEPLLARLAHVVGAMWPFPSLNSL
jgi:hypothetical protein